MEKQECYLVSAGFGYYEDHYTQHDCVFLNRQDAEARKKELIALYTTPVPFPFDWCTQEEFEDNIQMGLSTKEDYEIYDNWDIENDVRRDYTGTYITTLELR